MTIMPQSCPVMTDIGCNRGTFGSWWDDNLCFALSASYALVSLFAFVQLIRIEIRVPEYGLTNQKAFNLMVSVFSGVRALLFVFHKQVLSNHKALTLLLLDLPVLLHFSTYAVLVRYWAEIYTQARSLPSDNLRKNYVSINGAIYFIQGCISLYLWIDDNSIVESIRKIFIATVSFIGALGFLLYGGRLYVMLKRFPYQSKGRLKKLHEIGSVTAICFSCFMIRCFVVMSSAFDSNASTDVREHSIFNFIYYMLVEILPSALVLYILRRLPRKQVYPR